MLAASMYLELAGGTCYAWGTLITRRRLIVLVLTHGPFSGAYSVQIGAVLNLTNPQVNTIGSLGNIGLYCSVRVVVLRVGRLGFLIITPHHHPLPVVGWSLR